jgi:UDP:flavonoid glycosyltransferase YjiC (YdhE family)
MRVLVVTWDGGGNLPPMLGIARALARRGDQVRVLGHEVQRAAIEQAGLSFTPFQRGRDYVSAEPRGTVQGVLGLAALFADRGIGADAAALLAEESAEMVLVDCLLWGAIDELANTGVPVVSVVHSIADFFDRNARGPLGMLARLRGTNPVAALDRAALTLVTTRSDFEPKEVSGVRERHTGFVWQEEPVRAVAQGRPQVLVSFSTTAFPGQSRALRHVLDALAPLDLDVVATTGAVDPAALRAPSNARVLRHLDHAELLPTTSLVVGHGGHATTARALSAGIPVLVMPMHPLMDQPAVGRAVTRLNVGAMLPKSASTSRIRDAAEHLLTDGAIRKAAQEMGAQSRARDGAEFAAAALDELAGSV